MHNSNIALIRPSHLRYLFRIFIFEEPGEDWVTAKMKSSGSADVVEHIKMELSCKVFSETTDVCHELIAAGKQCL